jgi:hypothetical protein
MKICKKCKKKKDNIFFSNKKITCKSCINKRQNELRILNKKIIKKMYFKSIRKQENEINNKIDKIISEEECYLYFDYSITENIRIKQVNESQFKVKNHLNNIILKNNFIIIPSKLNK